MSDSTLIYQRVLFVSSWDRARTLNKQHSVITKCDISDESRWFLQQFSQPNTKIQCNSALRTPVPNGQFCLSRQKAHLFSLKITRFIQTPVNTDNGYFSVSQVTNSPVINPALQTVLFCTLSTTKYLISENLTETASELSKVLSNIQTAWLSCLIRTFG